jgi:signal peptidase II
LVQLINRQVSTLTSHLIFWPILLAGLAADLFSKALIFKWLEKLAGQQYSVIDGLFQFVMVENRGAAWGIAADKRATLVVVSVAALIIVMGVFLCGKKHQMLSVIALGLFAAGICGNMYDRICNNGRVRDFLDFYYADYHFPAFNLADSMLTIAVGLLILASCFTPKENNNNDTQCRREQPSQV